MEPLPAAHIAGLTPKDVNINFFDDRMEYINYDVPTDLVAISVETYTAKRSYQIASEFRRRNIPVVMGGFHPTLVPDEVKDYAESIVIGEAEGVWEELVEDFRNGNLKKIYKKENRPSLTRLSPNRDIFKGKKYLPIGLVEASRGCTFKCDFCVIQSYFNSTQNRRDIDSILSEISRLKKEKKLFFFVDDNTVSHPKEAKEFYKALKPLKIRWVSQASITMTHDEELLALMKDSGCQGVLIGFESLNSDNLKLMNKNFNTFKGGARAAVRNMHKFGLRLYATFIFGYENDTLDSFREAVDFCVENKIYMAAFNHLTPFPGTPLYKKLEEENLLLYSKWWLDDNYKYGQIPFRTNLSEKIIQDECVRARKSFYSVPSIFKRALSKTNSGGLFMFYSYLFINILLRKEATLRENYPLGDLGYNKKILKVGET
ncbi:MAG: B12-binding domain-containing radical SAM protein [Leptospiraceae bacterium]|nr:B12-binding domain-containing radical SAM protein [Leptospiraceae bacterium]